MAFLPILAQKWDFLKLIEIDAEDAREPVLIESTHKLSYFWSIWQYFNKNMKNINTIKKCKKFIFDFDTQYSRVTLCTKFDDFPANLRPTFFCRPEKKNGQGYPLPVLPILAQ